MDNHGTFKQVSSDYNEKFSEQTKQVGYQFQKSLYAYDSFQSSIERKFAVLIDKNFIVIDNDELYYLVEIKSEEDRDNEVVKRKSEVANK
nr:5791_t:CDS:2 [Entrophospora candida]